MSTIAIPTCKRAALLSAVEAAARLAAKQTALPILTHMLLKPEGDRIRIEASDQERFLSLTCEGHIPSDICLPAADLLSRIKALPGDEIIFDVDGLTAKLSSGASRFTLAGLPSNDMPSIPQVSDEWAITIPCGVMRRLLSQTLCAVSSDVTRVQYTGVLFESLEDEPHTLRAVSTDGVVRVAVATAEFEQDIPEIHFILPKPAADEVLRMCASGESVEMTAGHNLARFTVGERALTTRLLEGAFAPWRRVVPRESTTTAEVNAKELVDALGRIELSARDDQFRSKFTIGDAGIHLEAAVRNREAQDDVAGEVTGDDIDIALQCVFIAEAVSRCGNERVTLGFTTSLSPVVVRPVGETADEYLAVQSPMHLA